MTSRIIVVAIGLTSISCVAVAQSKNPLVGTWKLVSAKDTTEKGGIRDSYGRNPTGFLTYTADGRMIGIITTDGRKPLSVPDYVSAPAAERAEAFATLVSYAGTYTFTGDKVIHHVQASWMQNFLNTDQVRLIVKLEADRVTLRTQPFLKGGVQVTQELVWERMK
jgi:lipocalin-like protein